MNFLEFSNYLYEHKSTRLGNKSEDWHRALLDRGFNCQASGNVVEYVRYILIGDTQYKITIFELYKSIIMRLRDIDSEDNCFAERIVERTFRKDTTMDIIGEMFKECLDAFGKYL